MTFYEMNLGSGPLLLRYEQQMKTWSVFLSHSMSEKPTPSSAVYVVLVTNYSGQWVNPTVIALHRH